MERQITINFEKNKKSRKKSKKKFHTKNPLNSLNKKQHNDSNNKLQNNFGCGFIMMKRNDSVIELLKYPPAFMLLVQIALRAKRTSKFTVNQLDIGEALIGDYSNIGLTRQQYRTALKKLEKWTFITTRTTTRGTIAMLSNKAIFDINEETNNQQTNHLTTNRQPSNNQPATTNNNDNNDNNEIKEIISYLNSKTNKNFRISTAMNRSWITNWLRQNFTVENFKTVIENKVSDWIDDPKYNKYLRPETLFGDKFESYLNENRKNKQHIAGRYNVGKKDFSNQKL